MIIPCIDLMDGKVVQLVQGREKALEGRSPEETLEQFAGFPEIQVIDLDAAMGRGANSEIVRDLSTRAKLRVGGGVRTPQRAAELLNQGAHRVIIGTAAFEPNGVNHAFLHSVRDTVGTEPVTIALDSKDGYVVVKGWRETTRWTAAEVIRELEPYCSGFLCTYVDKEGMMQGTDLAWFQSLRQTTSHGLTAAGGITTLDDIQALSNLHIDSAIGMAIYTGRLSLDDLRQVHQTLANVSARE